MVTIKNIEMKNGIISMMCYMEDEPTRSFSLQVDSNDFHVLENSLGQMNIYSRMAINKVRNVLRKESSLPTELFSYWC